MLQEALQALKNLLRRHAMDSLARREHSRYELHNKLRHKFPEAGGDILDEVLNQLEAGGLLSDERFTEVYVHYRKQRGFGPVAIRHHLRACRVTDSCILRYLSESDPDWLEVLESLYVRKSGAGTGASANDRTVPSRIAEPQYRQKLTRFFLSRGFTSEQIRQLWRKYGY